MTSSLKQLFAILILTLSVARCQAAPAPLPPEKMWEYSDAIVVVDVVSLTHTGETGLQGEPIYLAKMRVRQVHKGRLRAGHVMNWQMSNYQAAAGEVGGGVAYPGQRLQLYLRRYPNGSYNTWGHNCCETIREAPRQLRRLPEQPGDTLSVRGSASPCVKP